VLDGPRWPRATRPERSAVRLKERGGSAEAPDAARVRVVISRSSEGRSMSLAPAHPGPGQGRSHRLDAALAQLLAQAPHMQAAAVVSFDGLPMASALPPGMDEDRVAAMSAALLSLGERAAAGLGRGELSQVYIEGDNGTVFLVSADDEAVLVAVAGKEAKVGLMLFEAKQAAIAVASALRADDADAEAHATAAVVAAAQGVPAQTASLPHEVPSTAVHVPVETTEPVYPPLIEPAELAHPQVPEPVVEPVVTEPTVGDVGAPATAHAESAEALVAREWAARSTGWV
jgi:predicted regulator of Ras-like GTPase activity (Roadblock/LC7/MglB family)